MVQHRSASRCSESACRLGKLIGFASLAWLCVHTAIAADKGPPAATLAPALIPWLDESSDKANQPGLIATFRQSSPEPMVLVRVDRTPSFLLKADESPHPRLDARHWSAHWRGHLQILRPGKYQFSAEVAGRVSVRVADQQALHAESPDGGTTTGDEVELRAGELPITIEFEKTGDAARLRLMWQSQSFRREPVPWRSFGHRVADEPPALDQFAEHDRGRLLVEELACAACHEPAADDLLGQTLSKRPGPDLSRVGERAYAGWIYRWLESPQSFRAQSVMPRMFSDDERGRTERHAVAFYLASLGGPLRGEREANRNELRNWRRRGEQLFHRVGCSVCHTANGQPIASLQHMGSKTTPGQLARFLQNPLAIDPSGRMPSLSLDGGEARDIAHYLCESVDNEIARELPTAPPDESIRKLLDELESQAAERDRLAKLSPTDRLLALGARLVAAKGCASCHPMPAERAAVAKRAGSLESIRKRVSSEESCLSAKGVSADRPRFSVSPADRASVEAFLRDGSRGAGSAAPSFHAEQTLIRFHCVGCHSVRGSGGLTAELMDSLRQYENAQDAESIMPPPLDEVAAKLRPSWLRGVLQEGRRARPWMALRMPQFGEAHVKGLPEGLASVEAIDSTDAQPEFSYASERIEAGRRLVGSKGFGCISCHDIAGRPNYGTRGPDLASMHQRIRYPWYKRWLDDSQRMQPGTRMPTVFPNGQSAVKNLFGGDGDQQSDAIWQYLSLGANLPLPEGLEPPRGLVIEPRERPILVRTFMPDVGNRAFAIGFPSGVNVAFDSSQCRLAYGWTGSFLDATPIWTNRGGAPARIDGPRFWTAPDGFPWSFTASPSTLPKSWAERRTDARWGGRLPEGTVPAGPNWFQFRGYTSDAERAAIFRYEVTSPIEGDVRSVAVVESCATRQELAGIALERHFELSAANLTAWLLVAETTHKPQLLDADGRPISLPDLELIEQPTTGAVLRVAQGPAGVQLVWAHSQPAGSHWVLRRDNGKWYAMVRLTGSTTPTKLRLAIWSPYRDDDTMIRTLLHLERRP